MASDPPSSPTPKMFRVDSDDKAILSLDESNNDNDHISEVDHQEALMMSPPRIGQKLNTSNAPIRGPAYNYIQKLASSAPQFLAKDDKNEKYPKKMSISQACEIFASYENRLEEWNKLETKIRLRVLRKIFENQAQKGQNNFPCPSCSRKYSSALGLHYHMEKCALDFEQIKCPRCAKTINAKEYDIHMVIEHDSSDSFREAISADYSVNEDDESTPISCLINLGQKTPNSAVFENLRMRAISRSQDQKIDVSKANEHHDCSLCNLTINNLRTMEHHLRMYHRLSDHVISRFMTSSAKSSNGKFSNGEEKCAECNVKERKLEECKAFLDTFVNSAVGLRDKL